jgi:hypothetical protein
VISTEPTAAIMPPARQLIRCGLTLQKSNAGEMKFATMLMPMVAIVKVSAPSTMAKVLSMRATVATGSVMSSPKTGMVSDEVTTTRIENARKFTGRPSRLPRLTARNDLPYPEKSPKLSIGPQKYDTTRAKVWMPYQATAIAPRMMAGTFAPRTPKTVRQIAGYGTPVSCDGLATRLQKK